MLDTKITWRESPLTMKEFTTRLKKKVSDLRDFFSVAGLQILQAGIARNFIQESFPSGGKWQELAPLTQRIRKSRGYDPRHLILVQSGYMRDRLLSPKPESLRITKHEMLLGAKGRHGQAFALHFGGYAEGSHAKGTIGQKLTQKPGGRIPARHFLEVDLQTIQYLKNVLLSYITEGAVPLNKSLSSFRGNMTRQSGFMKQAWK